MLENTDSFAYSQLKNNNKKRKIYNFSKFSKIKLNFVRMHKVKNLIKNVYVLDKINLFICKEIESTKTSLLKVLHLL